MDKKSPLFKLVVAALLVATGIYFLGFDFTPPETTEGLEKEARKCYAGDEEVQCPAEQGHEEAIAGESNEATESKDEDAYIPKPYKRVTEKPSGWFRSGQEADLILHATGFNDSGGPLMLNHPGKAATDGKRLIVSDTWNNRVLIWNDIPTKKNQAPDLVLGQPDFHSNTGRLGADGMNWPMGVATDGKRLLAADANNDRVLIWNTFPTRNGQPADIVLGAPDFETWPTYLDWEGERDDRRRINWPWDVWTDGEKVAVTSTTDSSVLIWNTFPTKNNQPADIILGQKDFPTRFRDKSEIPGYEEDKLAKLFTPRSIDSDGKRLLVGNYGEEGLYVWNEFPTRNGQQADIQLQPKRQDDEPPDSVMGVELEGDRLFAASSHHLFVWNEFPTASGESPDAKLGVQRTRDEYLIKPDKMIFPTDTFNWPTDVESGGGKLIVASDNRILIFNKIPEKPDAKADVVLGNPEVFASRNSFGSGAAPFSDGNRLVVGVDGFGVWIYNNIPDESRAEADTVVGKLLRTTVVGGPAIIVGEKLVMVHREGSSVMIWNKVPEKDNTLPDVILGKMVVLDEWGRAGKGRSGLNQPQMAASDGKRLFVTDSGNNRILVWNDIPEENQTPADIVLGQKDFESTEPGSGLDQLDSPVQVSTDGKRLVASDQSNRRVLVWKEIPEESGKAADFEIRIINHSKNIADLPPTARLSLTGGAYVYDDRLFVADTGNNRVLVWSRFPQSAEDEPDIVLGQPDFKSQYRTNSKDALFMPFYLSFDGSYLWVGEFKFSNRLLRFSIGK